MVGVHSNCSKLIETIGSLYTNMIDFLMLFAITGVGLLVAERIMKVFDESKRDDSWKD